MKPEKIIEDFKKNIYCRVKVSPIHGVGVFAVRPIPKGTNPFKGSRTSTFTAVPKEKIFSDAAITPAVKEMVRAFYSVTKTQVYLPTHSLNAIDVSYFMNQSKHPNISARGGNKKPIFVAKRNILAGEELTIDYSTL